VEFLNGNRTTFEDLNLDDFVSLFEAANYLDFERLLLTQSPQLANRLVQLIDNNDIMAFKRTTIRTKEFITTVMCFVKGKDIWRFERFMIKAHDESRNPRMRRVLYNVGALRNTGLKYQYNENTGLLYAAETGMFKVIKRMLEMPSEWDPAVQHNTAMRLAVEKGHIMVVQVLSEDDRVLKDIQGKPDYENLLAIAATKNNFDMVNLLLHHKRYNVGFHGANAILLAGRRGYWEMV